MIIAREISEVVIKFTQIDVLLLLLLYYITIIITIVSPVFNRLL